MNPYSRIRIFDFEVVYLDDEMSGAAAVSKRNYDKKKFYPNFSPKVTRSKKDKQTKFWFIYLSNDNYKKIKLIF